MMISSPWSSLARLRLAKPGRIFSLTLRSYSTVPSPPLRGFTQIPRSLISICGPDAAKFLNGIVTNKVSEDTDLEGIYAGFLNAQGRVLSDSFIYPAHHSTLLQNVIPKEYSGSLSYIIDCDPSVANNLVTMFRIHKLRSKIHVAPLESQQFSLWHVWDDSEAVEQLPLSIVNRNVLNPYLPDLVGATDLRAGPDGYFGLRLILPADKTPLDALSRAFLEAGELEHASLQSYNVRRLLYGIPEGAQELTPSKALPLEYCMDFMGGVDFDKGCYQGQELTIRTYHHGMIRKRVVPVTLSLQEPQDYNLEYDPSALSGMTNPELHLLRQSIYDISSSSTPQPELAPSPFQSQSPFGSRPKRRQESVGTLLTLIGNVGLALVRLEAFSNENARFVIKLDDKDSYVHVQGYQPFWWPQ
uniref:ARAD1A02288p n=1 Tax=Blastobotrys adeninivorans TaxID=409370 RepID=A0A060SW56_BLAAD